MPPGGPKSPKNTLLNSSATPPLGNNLFIANPANGVGPGTNPCPNKLTPVTNPLGDILIFESSPKIRLPMYPPNGYTNISCPEPFGSSAKKPSPEKPIVFAPLEPLIPS